MDHVWQCLQQLNRSPDLIARPPSSTLMRKIFYGHACTLSGRLRGHVNFTQRANTPFQGLAADGNKLALFRLLRAGYQVCGFIHDEALVLIPHGADYTAEVHQVQQILADAMQELCPDIPIATEYLLADRWYKDVDEQPTDSSGQIVPYRQPQRIEQPTPVPVASQDAQAKPALAPTGNRRTAYDADSIRPAAQRQNRKNRMFMDELQIDKEKCPPTVGSGNS